MIKKKRTAARKSDGIRWPAPLVADRATLYPVAACPWPIDSVHICRYAIARLLHASSGAQPMRSGHDRCWHQLVALNGRMLPRGTREHGWRIRRITPSSSAASAANIKIFKWEASRKWPDYKTEETASLCVSFLTSSQIAEICPDFIFILYNKKFKDIFGVVAAASSPTCSGCKARV